MPQLKKIKAYDTIIKLILLSTAIALIISSSGCIHIDLGNPFKDPEKKPTEYQIVDKLDPPITQTFDFNNLNSIETSITKPFYVQDGTEWVNVSIEIIINTYFNTSIWNSTMIERYVTIIIDGPEGVYFDQKFTESTKFLRPLIPPSSGTWIIKVEGRGWGYEDTKDHFEISATAYEPV